MSEAIDKQDDGLGRFWNEKAGPFYDVDGLFKWFGYTREFLDDRVRAREVLQVVSSDGFAMFPSFQFDAAGTLLPRLAEMLQAVDPDMKDPWGDALWFNAPREDLDGLTPAQALRTDRADDVLMIGSHAGAHWLP